MPLYRFLASPLLTGVALLHSGCDSIDIVQHQSAVVPSVTVTPSLHVPGLNMVRSGESFSGKVSWYSVKTNGGTRTASGETFTDHENTAAHRTLPFGTLVEVTNLANDRTEILRIIDRGPYKHGRVLDVSIGAAKKLGFDKQGITTCKIQVLEPAPEISEPVAESNDEATEPVAEPAVETVPDPI
ncbi:MAG TPA: septal ring lytic transglycosylase RlpA family protein [Bacteroidia bacterium]|nr:septal ring lytic transglycosylase RlpA family protein [Bacteroidia bacterium]